MNSMKSVTVVITACDRLDLLERTLRSFLAYNTYPIENFIIRDDSGLEDVWMKTKSLMNMLGTSRRNLLPIGQLGQAASIDAMMRWVTTPYVFHLEDDWEFDRPGFIEDCFIDMSERVSQVCVRHQDDGSARQYVEYSPLTDRAINHLFSFNPHLRRTNLISKFEGTNETILGQAMEKLGLYTLTLKEGACRHIGGDKTTNRPGTPYHAGVRKA